MPLLSKLFVFCWRRFCVCGKRKHKRTVGKESPSLHLRTKWHLPSLLKTPDVSELLRRQNLVQAFVARSLPRRRIQVWTVAKGIEHCLVFIGHLRPTDWAMQDIRSVVFLRQWLSNKNPIGALRWTASPTILRQPVPFF